MESDVTSLFTSFRGYLEEDQKLREKINLIVKKLELDGREIVTILQVVHNSGGTDKISASCAQCREIIERNVKPSYAELDQILLSNSSSQYYKYHDNWRYINQRMCFAISLITYLENGQLVTYEDVAKILGIKCDREEGFHLDLEDYLTGLLQLSSELSRLAVNSVVYGDYERPLHISQFVSKLNAGFQLLNFKNDSLRRRFDGLKYDVKKIEEVVYDLSIRGLKQNAAGEE
ncbi:hypothetical protein RUM43_011983 [Polyplax serrata]|uniref:Translin n=1 Tax=Polyplax serrata TaxID=468196 RepID=A0AAN8P1V1_POLSC